jgi:hypothetical protein
MYFLVYNRSSQLDKFWELLFMRQLRQEPSIKLTKHKNVFPNFMAPHLCSFYYNRSNSVTYKSPFSGISFITPISSACPNYLNIIVTHDLHELCQWHSQAAFWPHLLYNFCHMFIETAWLEREIFVLMCYLTWLL